ncbi:MAG: hypothetical protein JWQ34_327 [Mucilaginibacter sp.]|uniref:hypothetical protein n=1 Tax=Mucilaginibacter sp. TaxID=1882438 RepID=UPI0026351453|nr:hypothetical protein [Mucilaginibacter sp.]MDB5002102.1 hypothetical protein [Mucilaginibacter sp.]
MDTTNSATLSLLIESEFNIKGKIIKDFGKWKGKPISHTIIFEDCVFESDYSFIDTVAQNDIFFNNCTFKNLSFLNCSFEQFIAFNNCTLQGELFFSDCKFSFISFSGGTYSKMEFAGFINAYSNRDSYINFENGNFTSLKLSCKEINCPITITGGTYDTIHVEKTKMNQRFLFSEGDIKINELYLISSEFNDRVDLLKGEVTGTTYIHKVSFNEQVVIGRDFLSRSLTIAHVYAKQNFSISFDGNITHLYLSDNDFQGTFNCHSLSTEPRTRAGELSCDISGLNKGNILFESIPASINVGGVNLGNIIFKNIETNFIIIQDFYNQNKLTFADLKLIHNQHFFIIFDSNINNTEFVNVDFRKFDELVIAKSEVSNIVLSNSVLPPRIQIGTKNPIFGYVIKPDEKINDNTYYRETYRQLKLAMEKQGNKASSLIFKAKEMHYLRKELPIGWDKFLLYLNYISNNHGLSWSRGICFTLVISWLMFIFFQETLVHPNYVWGLSWSLSDTYKSFKSGLNGYSEFITSFPGFKVSEHSSYKWETNLILLLSRILIGYGIYQTITAFRKFANK